MRRGLEWYKREPRAFLDGCRAARMTERQLAVYTIIIDLIYDHGGETPDDPKHIASYLSDVGAAGVRNTVQQLIDLGKLFRIGDMLHQKRAENEAKTREKLSENRAKVGRLGGVSSGNSRRASSEINALAEANASSKHEAEKEKREIVEEERPKGLLSFPSNDDLETAIDDYNDSAEKAGWPKVKALTKARAAALKARLRECGGLAGWRAALARARASPHLCGQNERGWTASFDFLTAQSSFSKLMEGNYDARPSHQNAGPATPGGQRPDPAVEQITRLVRSRHAPGPGGAGTGGSGEKD